MQNNFYMSKLILSLPHLCDALPGIFDEETEKAIIKFQTQRGLLVNGIVDPITLKTLGLRAHGELTTTNSNQVSLSSHPTIEGIDSENLSPAEKNALAILANLNLDKLNQIKHFLNLGIPGVIVPTTLNQFLKLLQGASAEFLRWTHAGGKVLAGLVRRTKAERDLFLS